MVSMLERLDGRELRDCSVLDWACPVPFFGELGSARVATVGINPSRREFVDDADRRLSVRAQRFPTLHSLGLSRWAEVDTVQVRAIVKACTAYFAGNPYDRWFRVLERVLGHSGLTLYGAPSTACHLDLVPYATSVKWGELTPSQRRKLLGIGGETFAEVLRRSSVRVLVLNGRSVIQQFETLCGVRLQRKPADGWSLYRSGMSTVEGFAYWGEIASVGPIPLDAPVRIVGYNHNLQSSFGVTRLALEAISEWLCSMVVL